MWNVHMLICTGGVEVAFALVQMILLIILVGHAKEDTIYIDISITVVAVAIMLLVRRVFRCCAGAWLFWSEGRQSRAQRERGHTST